MKIASSEFTASLVAGLLIMDAHRDSGGAGDLAELSFSINGEDLKRVVPADNAFDAVQAHILLGCEVSAVRFFYAATA